ncbi:MAG: HIT family protein [bacterium]|nr:HIT family protein [bacterium]
MEQGMDNDCIFCDRVKLAERLIAEIDNWYVVATLGQIISGYTLVIPKGHFSCMGALTSPQPGDSTESILKITEKVCRALSLEYQCGEPEAPYPVTMFEHGVVGQTIKHAHLHLLPMAIDLTPKILMDFPGAELEELRYAEHLQELYSKRQEPYLFWTVPSGKSMVCWNPLAPPQYLRLITAELIGYPERGNWRNMNPELDKQMGKETVLRLKSYF